MAIKFSFFIKHRNHYKLKALIIIIFFSLGKKKFDFWKGKFCLNEDICTHFIAIFSSSDLTLGNSSRTDPQRDIRF